MKVSVFYLSVVLPIVFISIFTMTVRSQGYNGFNPISTTCEEIEQRYRIDACNQREAKVESKNERVRFYFSSVQCELFFGRRWKVANGTLIAIIVEYLTPRALSSFDYELGQFKRSENDNEIFYRNKDNSVQLTVIDSEVMSVWFLPPNNRPELSCDCS
jgi:hypothetical protein